MEKGEGDKLDYLSNAFIGLPAEKKDSVLEKALALLTIQGKDEKLAPAPVDKKKRAE
jgi:hypothetical protein